MVVAARVARAAAERAAAVAVPVVVPMAVAVMALAYPVAPFATTLLRVAATTRAMRARSHLMSRALALPLEE